MSATDAFLGGLPRAAQKPSLTLAYAGSTALATLLVGVPLFMMLAGPLGGASGGLDFLRHGDFLPLQIALDESQAGRLLAGLLLVALPLFGLLRIYLAGGVAARLNPADGYGAGQSFFGLGARHFWAFLFHAILNALFTGLLLGCALAASAPLKMIAENAETPAAAMWLAGARMVMLWFAVALGTRALDYGRAHMLMRGGFRPVDGWLTGIKAVVTRPGLAIGLCVWGGLTRLTLFALWFGLDYALHIRGPFSWLIALALLGGQLLLAEFLRVTLMAAAFIVLERR